MQMGSNISPAAETYRRENERQSVRTELDEALDDTSPASNPISAARTTKPGNTKLETPHGEGIRSAVEGRIRARPLAAIVFAAGLGFIFGLTR